MQKVEYSFIGGGGPSSKGTEPPSSPWLSSVRKWGACRKHSTACGLNVSRAQGCQFAAKASHGENIQEKNISSIYITMGISDTNSELCFHKFLKFNLSLVVGISTLAFFKKNICVICLLSGLTLPEMILTTTLLCKSLVRSCQKEIALGELVKSLVHWTKQVFILFLLGCSTWTLNHPYFHLLP